MHPHPFLRCLLALCVFLALPASAQAPAATPGPAASPVERLPLVVVHKSPTCGCCVVWAEHMRKAGFTVELRDENDLGPVKHRAGLPAGKHSCHTAMVAGYFIEGHVPAVDVKRLLATKPDAKGLIVPGMPIGSPGMEMPDGRVQPYAVELVKRDGTTEVYSRHGEAGGD